MCLYIYVLQLANGCPVGKRRVGAPRQQWHHFTHRHAWRNYSDAGAGPLAVSWPLDEPLSTAAHACDTSSPTEAGSEGEKQRK